MQKDEQNTLAIIDNYNFYDTPTYTRTWRLYDRLAQRAESVKKMQSRQNIGFLHVLDSDINHFH